MILTNLEDIALVNPGPPVRENGLDIGGNPISGLMHARALVTERVHLGLIYFQYDDSRKGEIGCRDMFAGPDLLGPKVGIVGRLRIGVYTQGDVTFAEMWGARYEPHHGPFGFIAKKKSLSIAELDRSVGGSIVEFLLGKGVSRVGTRAELFGDTSRAKKRLAAQLPDASSAEPAIWVFAVTRALPLIRQIEEGL